MPTFNSKERALDPQPEPPRKKIKFLHQCHIPKEILEEKEIMVFVQETQHKQQGRMQWVILTQNFTKLHEVNSVRRYGYNVGLDGFLNLRICGNDMDWVIEFLSTLNENKVVTIIDHQGEKNQIILTAQLVNEALKLPNEGYVLGTWLSSKDKAREFKQTPGKLLTYADLKHPFRASTQTASLALSNGQDH